ncbi:TolC family protein [Hydrogenimonas sp.]
MALNVSKRRWLLFSLSAALLSGHALMGAEADTLLSMFKQKQLELDRKKSSADSGQLEYSWINPIRLRYSDSRSTQFDRTQTNRAFSVTVDQPIFKSGGIWYAIKYAKATRRVGYLGVETQRRTLIKQTVAALINIRKNEYQIEKQRLLIENDRIDILRKKEQFLSGDLDSGFLDQAILKKNQDTLALYGLQDILSSLHTQFSNLSDMDPNRVRLPRFTLMTKKRFMKDNVDLAQARAQIDQKSYFETMTWARYLVTLSLQGSYVKPYENSSVFGGSIPHALDAYTNYGFSISIPIDVTSYYTIESSRVDYLRAKIDLADKRREASNGYENVRKRIAIVDRKISLAREDENLYDSLVKSTSEKVEAGEMTQYDLETMENSRTIRRLDQKIYDLEKQLVLLDLYEKSYEAIQ